MSYSATGQYNKNLSAKMSIMSRLRSPRNIENLINHSAVFFMWLLEIPKKKDLKGKGKVAQSCPILCKPMNCIVPGQTFSRGSSQYRD